MDGNDGHTLQGFLCANALAHLEAALAPHSLITLIAHCLADRPSFLRMLRQHHGMREMSERQKLANALLRDVRKGTLPAMSSAADILRSIGEAQLASGGGTVLMPLEVRSQRADAPPSRIPRVIFQTNRTRRVGAAVWRNVVRMLEANPEYSYRFFDDIRCVELLGEQFDPAVVEAFHALRAGAAKADLWRYCALYTHGGVYLDLDSCIFGSLDSLVSPAADSHFMYDAEANLIQWVLIAGPRHPVLKRCIEMATARIERREPNIFLATGPTVFTDAWLESAVAKQSDERAFAKQLTAGQQAERAAVGAVYGSRTTLNWHARMALFSREGIHPEASDTLCAVFEGYAYADVYAVGESERYLPTWGAEPTRGLYHPIDLDESASIAEAEAAALGRCGGDEGGGGLSGAAAEPASDPPASEPTPERAAERGAEALSSEPLYGRYRWDGLDYDSGSEDVDPFTGEQSASRLRWSCSLVLGRLPDHEEEEEGLEGQSRRRRRVPFAPVVLRYEFVREAVPLEALHARRAEEVEAAGEVEARRGALCGVWRRAPGKPDQLHLFEWRLHGAAPADMPTPDLSLRCTPDPTGLTGAEAPSVMVVCAPENIEELEQRYGRAGSLVRPGGTTAKGTAARASLVVQGWEGGADIFGVAARMRRARHGRQKDKPGHGIEPIIFRPTS